MDALKVRTVQALVDRAELLGGHVALAGGDDPDDFALGLEGQHVIQIEQEVLLSGAADHLPAAGGGWRFGNFTEMGQGLGRIARPGAEGAGAVEGLFQAFPADRFEQVIESAGFEGADGVLVVGGDNDDHRQGARGQTANHVESAHAGHLQIQKDEIGLKTGDIAEGIVAVGRLTHNLDAGESRQFVAQHLAGHRFIVDDQGAHCGSHLGRSQTLRGR